MFTEEEVRKALEEIRHPDVETWEPFSETNSFRVYRRPVPGSPLKEYKVLGCYPDLPPRYLVKAYMDLDFRKTWDKNMMSWKSLPDNRRHYVSKFPWPLSPRDYVYEMRVQEFSDGVYCINGKSVTDETMPEQQGTVRVDDFRQDVVIRQTEDGRGCHVWFSYYDNPKGNIPTSIINWAARSGIPAFLGAMREAGLKLMSRDSGNQTLNEKSLPLSDLKEATCAPVNC